MAASDIGDVDCFICKVCHRNMVSREPRILSCQHTFCTDCLSSLVKYRRIRCPSCYQLTEVLSSKAKYLQKNNLLLRLWRSEVEHYKLLCINCLRFPPEHTCNNCTINMCLECSQEHLQEFQGHIVSTLCPQHKKTLAYICYDCRKSVCDESIKEHSNHSYISFQEKVEKLQAKLIDIDTASEKAISKLKKTKNEKTGILKTEIHVYESNLQRLKEQLLYIEEVYSDTESKVNSLRESSKKNILTMSHKLEQQRSTYKNEPDVTFDSFSVEHEDEADKIVSDTITKLNSLVTDDSSVPNLVAKRLHAEMQLTVRNEIMKFWPYKLDGVFICTQNSSCVMLYDKQDKLIGKFQTPYQSIITDFVVSDAYIYIAHSHGISRGLINSMQQVKPLCEINLCDVSKIAVVGTSHIVILSTEIHKLYEYSLPEKKIVDVPIFMEYKPTNVSFEYSRSEELRYILTCLHRERTWILVCDKDWKVVQKISVSPSPEISLQRLQQTALTDVGSYFLLDQKYIMQFGNDGWLTGYVMYQKRILICDVFMYEAPYLWTYKQVDTKTSVIKIFELCSDAISFEHTMKK